MGAQSMYIVSKSVTRVGVCNQIKLGTKIVGTVKTMYFVHHKMWTVNTDTGDAILYEPGGFTVLVPLTS